MCSLITKAEKDNYLVGSTVYSTWDVLKLCVDHKEYIVHDSQTTETGALKGLVLLHSRLIF